MQPVKTPGMDNFFGEMGLVVAFLLRIQIVVVNRQMTGVAFQQNIFMIANRFRLLDWQERYQGAEDDTCQGYGDSG